MVETKFNLPETLVVTVTQRQLKLVLSAAAVGCSLYVGLKWMRRQLRQSQLRSLAEQERARRDETIRAVEQALLETPVDIRRQIQSLDYAELKQSLRSGGHSALQVLHAYQELALQAHAATNCITEFLLDAVDRARQLDQSGQAKELPLFGLPFSVKESINIQGRHSTGGHAGGIGQRAAFTAVSIEALTAAGAIAFVRTNVPAMLTFGCSNEVYGTTPNPHNQARSSGGSSCGEGALLAANGSVFGMGTDLGGSIRVPAAYCGIAGLRPTSSRVSQRGMFQPPTYAYLYPSGGPMSQSVQCIENVMSVLLAAASPTYSDPVVPPLHWQPTPAAQPLTIGYFETDPAFECAPAVQRAVLRAVKVLEGKGHRLVRFRIPDMDNCVKHYLSAAIMSDGRLSSEAAFADLAMLDFSWHYWLCGLPMSLRRLYLRAFVCRREADCYTCLPVDVAAVKQMFQRVTAFRQRVLSAMRDAGLQLLVMPANASVALNIQAVQVLQHAFIYTEVCNLLDLPAGVVTMGRVEQADIDAFGSRYQQNDVLDRLMVESNGTPDALGLPIAVQVAGLPYSDELVVSVMKQLQQETH